VENGKVAIKWKVVYTPDEDDGSTSANELKEKGYTLPEYHFVAEYNGVESEPGPVLEVKEWIYKQLIDENIEDILPNIKYTLYLPDGSTIRGVTDENGYMEKKHSIPFGLLEISLEEK
jgi:hypothetical protein